MPTPPAEKDLAAQRFHEAIAIRRTVAVEDGKPEAAALARIIDGDTDKASKALAADIYDETIDGINAEIAVQRELEGTGAELSVGDVKSAEIRRVKPENTADVAEATHAAVLTDAQYVAYLVKKVIGYESDDVSRMFAKFLVRVANGGINRADYWLNLVNVDKVALKDRTDIIKRFADLGEKQEDDLITELLNERTYMFYRDNNSYKPDGIFIVQSADAGGLVVMDVKGQSVLYKKSEDGANWVDTSGNVVRPYTKPMRPINPQSTTGREILNRHNHGRIFNDEVDGVITTRGGEVSIGRTADGRWEVVNTEPGSDLDPMLFDLKDQAEGEATRRYKRTEGVRQDISRTNAETIRRQKCQETS